VVNGISGGRGGIKPKNDLWGGDMDIFWNHSMLSGLCDPVIASFTCIVQNDL